MSWNKATEESAPNPDWIAVGRRLADVRGSYNQPVFAASLGISVRTLQRLEAGKRPMDSAVLLAAWKAHGVSPDSLLLGNSDPRLIMVCPRAINTHRQHVAVTPQWLHANHMRSAASSFQLENSTWAPVRGLMRGAVAIGISGTPDTDEPWAAAFEVGDQIAVGTLTRVTTLEGDRTRWSALIEESSGYIEESDLTVIGRVTCLLQPVGQRVDNTQQSLTKTLNAVSTQTARISGTESDPT